MAIKRKRKINGEISPMTIAENLYENFGESVCIAIEGCLAEVIKKYK